MKKMKNFMVVHRDPEVSWDKIEENWSKAVPRLFMHSRKSWQRMAMPPPWETKAGSHPT